jgi:hypothetical protein
MTTSRAPVAAAPAASVERRNGRAKAATISASAAMRTSSSSQLWIRRRRTDLNGICRTNMSDGKY